MSLSQQSVRDRVRAYYAALSAGDVEAILSMFAARAVMYDPVGAPAAEDEAGRRARYAGLAAFERFTIHEDALIVCGDEAAVKWTARGTLRDARAIGFEGISTFVFDADGRIARMSAYWDPATVLAAVQG